ncbi:hypothetical protein [Thalassospira alkalitolerans]|uniref:hypothetical protein n=1 Tax=Thalassospira alkalitolerans TaxID=1293890 RepID=UPI003AA7CE36
MLSADLETQIKTIASADEVDLARLQELDVKLAAWFDPRSGYQTCFAKGLATAAVNTSLRPANTRPAASHARSISVPLDSEESRVHSFGGIACQTATTVCGQF